MTMSPTMLKEKLQSPSFPKPDNEKAIQDSLQHLVNGLVAKGFSFMAPETTSDDWQKQIAEYDKGRLWLSKKIFGFAMGGADLPGFAETVMEHAIGFGTKKVEDADLLTLKKMMLESFPLCATGYSKLYGPRFVGILPGDDLTEEGLYGTLDAFQEINLQMMLLGGRMVLKLLGQPILGLNNSAATGTLVLVGSKSRTAEVLRDWVSNKPLQSDTIVNQIKERFSRWQFWAKAVFGMIEYKPHQLRQEIIILDAESKQATSTARPRLGFEFGFSLGDILPPTELPT